MWDFLGANVVDKPNNVNNRFAVAAKMNRLMTGEAKPFWGCPANDAQTWLSPTKPTGSLEGLPAQFRAADLATHGRGKGGAKPVWQIFGNGTVGSQAIVGINPTLFPSIYGASGMPSATTATIGIITQGSMTQTIADLKTFAANAGYPTPPVSVVTVGSRAPTRPASMNGTWTRRAPWRPPAARSSRCCSTPPPR